MSFDDRPGQPRPVQPPSPLSLVGPLLLVAAAAAGVAWFLGYIGPWSHRPLFDTDAAPRTVTARGDLAADEKSTIELFKAVSPSVVHITTLLTDRFGMEPEGVPAGAGSGFFWDADGYVVTNAHVMRDSNAARVLLQDGTTLPARLAAAAPDYDLAVLKVEARGRTFPAIPIGTSADLQVGQKAFAIGSPFGLDHTLTTGVISAIGRQINSLTRHKIDGAIQIDAAINQGNSGGPLLDSAGRLIGVNTQIVSPPGGNGGFIGIGFAIPVDTVNQVVPELIRGRRVSRPVIGVHLANDDIARRLGVESGVLILNVTPGGPADEAGLRPSRQVTNGRIALGDIIIRLAGQPIKSQADLVKTLAKQRVGDRVKVVVLRGSQEMEIEVVLGEG